MEIRNLQELNKINKKCAHAFEILTRVNGETQCVAYITTSEQWKHFLEFNDYTDGWVMCVDVENNVAKIWVEIL